MREDKKYTCCFFGHRKIEKTDDLENRLYEVIENLIVDKKVYIFLFGSRSQFDALCHKIVTILKVKYPYIQRIYVRAEYQYINDDYKEYLLKHYEDTYYPQRIENAGRAVYVERNREMIDKSDFCVVYYDENYTLSKRTNSSKNVPEFQPKSGTRIAYQYAQDKKCNIINLKLKLF